LKAKSDRVEVPKASKQAVQAFKRKFAYLGKALAYQELLGFLNRLQKSMADEKEVNAAKSQNAQKGQVAVESQYHGPSGKHTRDQSMYPGSIRPSMSYGGVVDGKGVKKKKRTRESIEDKLTAALSVIDEEVAIRSGQSALAAERGEFLVDGEVAIANHADILKILIMWLADNRPEVAKSAVDSIADMVRSGTIFRR